MAKLLIYRGETLLDERDLTEQTVTIGRGAQNTIVLEDPSKGVSREHAEIRYAGGRYTLVDRQSQNGIWVSGSRVPAVVLEPDVIASVGPYRLTVKAPVAEPIPAGTLETTIPEPPPEQTLAGVRAAPLELDKLVADVKAAPAPPPPPPAPKPARQAGAGSPGTGPGASRAGLAIAAGVALIALSAFIGYKVIHTPAKAPVWDETIAENLVAGGKCQEALDTQITPALKADPNNPKAIALRDRCASPPPPQAAATTSVPATPPAAERLTQADTLLAAKECQQAIDIANAVLVEEPNNDRAKDIVSRGTACLAPAPAAPERPPVAVAIPPSQGGLEPLPNETDKAYRERNKGMRSKFDEAITLLQNKKYQQAKRALDDIAPQVPNGYLDLAQRRQEAVEGMRGEAKAAFDAAQAADRANDFETALNLYRRAHDMDPSIQVDALIQKLTERRIALGTDRCNRGLTEASFGNNPEAIRLLQDAVKFLPANHECAAKARETLQKLGK